MWKTLKKSLGLTSSSSSSSSEDEAVIELAEFNRAVRACGFPQPPRAVYDYLANYAGDFTRQEMAMFLAQLIHESGGFQYREEYNPPHRYRDDDALPGRSYHGRGYIQLSWSENYKNASKALGLGRGLLENPDQVSASRRLSMRVSVWYWKKFVRPARKGKYLCFGVTTKAINGAIECNGEYNAAARDRYRKYRKVATAMQLDNIANETGCYN